MSHQFESAGMRAFPRTSAAFSRFILPRRIPSLLAILCLYATAQAESPFSVTGELAFYGPYGIGAGLGTFYEKPDLVPYVSGFWGSLAILRTDEAGVFEDYTETLLDIQGGADLDTSQIPVLKDVEKLDVFTGLTLGRRSYTYLDEDYSKILFGVVVGGLYTINDNWSAGGKFSTMTRDPRLLVRYSF